MKRILTVVIFATTFISVKACDICGCGVGNFNPYLFPHLSKNFFSLGWQHNAYHTHFMENGEMMHNKEYYNTLSLAAQFSPVKNLRLMAVIPFQFNRQTGMEGHKSLNRPGDVFLLANYKLIDQSACKKKMALRQSLLAGGGIKFATGDYHFDEGDEKEVGNSNFQAGTGSTDYLLNTYYSLRYGRWSFSTGIHYKINGTNKDGYRFGNRLMTLTQVKFVKELTSISLVPNAGIQTEKMAEDKQDGITVDGHRTGGFNTRALLGIDINTRTFALGISYAAPLQQRLAAGQIVARPGFAFHLSYSL